MFDYTTQELTLNLKWDELWHTESICNILKSLLLLVAKGDCQFFFFPNIFTLSLLLYDTFTFK